MACSIYFHIPFCKQACSYCDFHFSTNRSTEEAVISRMKDELIERSNQAPWNGQQVLSIYFGGGTPSILKSEVVLSLIELAREHFSVAENAEITLEANPDDISQEKIQQWYNSGINRLSVGIQSFHPEELAMCNRAHNAEEAHLALQHIQEGLIDNYSIDLIFGMPGSTPSSLKDNLHLLQQYMPPHLSCYSLTVEEKTALAHQVEKGKVLLPEENDILGQYALLRQWTKEQGYEHYELSNYAKPNRRSKHNAHYWSYAPYLGIGPGAHSFDGTTRFWNLSNNSLYAQGAQGESETLEGSQQINERMMVRLRTSEGFRYNLDLPENSHKQAWHPEFITNINAEAAKGTLMANSEGFRILPEHWMTSDTIISNLMMTHDENNH